MVNRKLPTEDLIKAGVKASPLSDINSGKSIYVPRSSIMKDIKPYLQEDFTLQTSLRMHVQIWDLKPLCD